MKKSNVLLVGLSALMFGCARSGHTNPPFDYSACSNGVYLHNDNAWLLTSPKIRIVFWGDWWQNAGISAYDSVASHWTKLGNSPAFYAPLAQYGIGVGSMPATYSTNWNIASGVLQDSDLVNELKAEIVSGELPAADSNTLYVIMLPEGTSTKIDNDGPYLGYHQYSNVNGQNFAYAFIENVNSLDTLISHEVDEAITDPGESGFYGVDGKHEIGDLCVGKFANVDGILIEEVWSEADCACIP